jgi:thiol-disulfide isomerase/thioredoxin
MISFTSITDSDFNREVTEFHLPVLVYFWAEWCNECQPLMQTVQTVSTEMGARVKIVLLNVDENPRMSRLHCIRMVPTLILFISGEERERIQGLTNRAHLASTIEMHLQDEVDNHPDLGNAAGEGIQPALKVKEKLRPIIRPAAKAPVKLELPRDKFYAILDLIKGSCNQFERTPVTFAKLDEEELRNVILSNLNSRYEIEAVGEAFCKRGKTDVYLRVQEGGIFVAECKNWAGGKTINEAVSQILNYLTWRDSYGVVIVFSKRKGFSKVLEAAASHILQLPSYITGFKKIDESHFSGSFALPEDEHKLVELHFIIYNLCDSEAREESQAD